MNHFNIVLAGHSYTDSHLEKHGWVKAYPIGTDPDYIIRNLTDNNLEIELHIKDKFINIIIKEN